MTLPIANRSLYNENIVVTGQNPVNATHVEVLLSGNGNLTLPNSTETIAVNSTGSALVNFETTSVTTPITSNSTSSNLNSWGSLKELSPKDNDCYDMSNAASAYLGIIAGAAVGGVITWRVYNLQNKMSRKQDHILHHIEEIEQKNR